MGHGGATWANRLKMMLLRAEKILVKWMWRKNRRNRDRTSEFMPMLESIEDLVTLVRLLALKWYGHIMRRDVTLGRY